MSIPFHNIRGFSYVEILVCVILIGITMVPAIESFQTGIKGATVNRSSSSKQSIAISKMELMLAEDFAALETEAVSLGSATTISSIYSDPINTNNRRLVYLSRYDGDNADGDGNPFTGVDAGLIWVRVDIENTPITYQTLTRQ